MQLKIVDDYDEMSRTAAQKVANLIRANNAIGHKTVLGLATGSTPIGLYKELVRMHKEEGLDFSDVTTFNLDEYWPIEKDDPRSFHHFMWEHLFSKVNINPDNIHIPDGTVKEEDIEAHCRAYEEEIRKAGGIDLQIVGVGAEGHIGFNECKEYDPNYSIDSVTRLVTLSPKTIADNNPPSDKAITMGMKTIMGAEKILLLASGEKKKMAMVRVFGSVLDMTAPVNLLKYHNNLEIVIDKELAERLPHYISERMENFSPSAAAAQRSR